MLADNRHLDFDQSAGSACTYPGDPPPISCVNSENSKILESGILPGFGNKSSYGLNSRTGQPFTSGSRVFQGPTRSGFESLNLGITWAPFNQRRDDTRPTWTLGFDAKLDVFSDMRFDSANPGGNTAVGPGYHQFVWSTFVSKRFRYFDPYFGAWYTLPVRTNGSIYQEINGGNQTAVNPQQRAGLLAGFEQIAWENPRADQRVTVEFRGAPSNTSSAAARARCGSPSRARRSAPRRRPRPTAAPASTTTSATRASAPTRASPRRSSTRASAATWASTSRSASTCAFAASSACWSTSPTTSRTRARASTATATAASTRTPALRGQRPLPRRDRRAGTPLQGRGHAGLVVVPRRLDHVLEDMTDVGAPAPEVYRLSMEKLPLAVGRARRLALLELLVAATALVAVAELALRGSTAATDAALVVWGLAAVGFPYVLWRAGQRVRRRWNAFELSIGGDTLRCAARGAGRVIMRLDEIASIAEGAGGLVVRSSDPGVVVRIPRTVEGFVDVRARLAARRPIEGAKARSGGASRSWAPVSSRRRQPSCGAARPASRPASCFASSRPPSREPSTSGGIRACRAPRRSRRSWRSSWPPCCRSPAFPCWRHSAESGSSAGAPPATRTTSP